MTDVSAEDLVERLRQSVSKLLGWAELYEPRTQQERARYDADLDEAEDLLEATGPLGSAHAIRAAARSAKEETVGTDD